MILQLGLLLVTYLGSKAYDSLKSEQKPVREEAEPQQARREAEDIAESREDIERQEVRHLAGALASMGFFASKYFVPGAVPLGLVAYLYSAIPYMKNVEKALVRDKKVNVDVLFFVADALTLGTKSYFAAALGLSMIHSGKYMVKKVKDDSAKEMATHLFRELPQSVWRLVDGVEIEMPLTDVRAGDLLVVNSGSVIPADGVIQEGFAQIDQRALTGEAQPAEKGKTDPVFANTIVIAGKIVIRVNRSGADTTSAQIAEILLHSVSFKSGVQLKGEKWADQMSLPMLGSAMALLPFIGPVSTAVFINAHIGARIRLFAPLTTLRHISEASMLGVLVKDGRALEQLCDVDTILFDKTGTLTTDEPEVKRVTPRNKHTPREILAYAATAERKLSHPIAKAILKKAEREGVTLHDLQDSHYTFGYGVSVIMEGKLIRVGSLR
ncbi:MAG: P-type ATPase, partial [Nitrospiria bacterium]